MAQVIIYHNPKCSKSRQALALLEEKRVNLTVVEYLKTPLSEIELTQLIHKLGIQARELLRKGEDEYTDLGLDNNALTNQQIIAAMAAHPKLIERPIVIANNRAIIARPPERVFEIL